MFKKLRKDVARPLAHFNCEKPGTNKGLAEELVRRVDRYTRRPPSVRAVGLAMDNMPDIKCVESEADLHRIVKPVFKS